MLLNPPDPILESIDGDTYILSVDFDAKFGYWLKSLQFRIPAGTRTDIASIPWWARSISDRASLGFLGPIIHDFLCDSKGKITTLEGEVIQITSFDAALLMLLLLRIDGIPIWRALIAFLGVIVGGPKF